jgi:hypothetical protein
MTWKPISTVLLLGLLLGCAGPGGGSVEQAGESDSIVWVVDNLNSIAGRPTTVLGTPRVIDTPHGTAVEFDGVEDALVLDLHPLAGAAEFTVEVVFRPDPGGEREQRFLHLQETGSKDRILFETRLTPEGRWFLDTYIKTGGEGHTLFAKQQLHNLGEWHHAALVVDGAGMRHYVNGELELGRPIQFAPQKPGRTSIGVRINEVSWFKGAIREARFTPRVLSPDKFQLLPASQ